MYNLKEPLYNYQYAASLATLEFKTYQEWTPSYITDEYYFLLNCLF